MDKALSGGSLHAIITAEVMRMKIRDDNMMVMLQAVTTYHDSLEFLRNIGSEHWQLLLVKGAELRSISRPQC